VVAQTTTGTDGTYALYVAAGTYTLTFSLDTYQSVTINQLAVGPGKVLIVSVALEWISLVDP
jgi:hypothetical protein